MRVARCGRKNRARRFAADAFFHLLELPQRDSHAGTLPAATKLQKQKRRAEIHVAAFWKSNERKINVPTNPNFDFCPIFVFRLARAMNGQAARCVRLAQHAAFEVENAASLEAQTMYCYCDLSCNSELARKGRRVSAIHAS